MSAKITVKQLESKEEDEIVLQWRGVHYTVLHSICGAAKEYIPIYCFDDRSMIIEKNTSTSFNNDKVREKFKHLPCLIANPRETLNQFDELDDEERYDKPYNATLKSIDQRYVARLHKRYDESNPRRIQLVTTDDLEIYENGLRVPNPYKEPDLIFELCRGQELKVVAPVMLGLGKHHESFSSCTRMFQTYDKEDEPQLILGTKGQLSPHEIFHRSCEILLTKANRVFADIHAKEDIDNEEGVIIIENEDYILGNILAHCCSRHLISSCHMPHLLQPIIHLYYHNASNKNIYELLHNAHKDLVALLTTMQQLVEKLSK